MFNKHAAMGACGRLSDVVRVITGGRGFTAGNLMPAVNIYNLPQAMKNLREAVIAMSAELTKGDDREANFNAIGPEATKLYACATELHLSGVEAIVTDLELVNDLRAAVDEYDEYIISLMRK